MIIIQNLTLQKIINNSYQTFFKLIRDLNKYFYCILKNKVF